MLSFPVSVLVKSSAVNGLALLDSGASLNFVSSAFAASHGLTPQPGPLVAVTLATGQQNTTDKVVPVTL